MNLAQTSRSVAQIAVKPDPHLGQYRFWLAAVLVALAALLSGSSQANDCPSILNHTFNRLQDGVPQNLCQYRGKVVLVVNTASYCGFTDQYGTLEALYRQYKDKGLVVLGFPANDFGNQEPGSNGRIATFCRRTYSVEFPMFEKSHVVGTSTNAFFSELTRLTGQPPQWNFHKYLISRDGKQLISFGSSVRPDDKPFHDAMQKMLQDRSLQ
ncbi:MAG: glutathione peroxidase [Parasulfuritortus sp.]|jgi:glutathione peroxidase|nr:glutathione peroxidase [Parasulfuritortus sp.]